MAQPLSAGKTLNLLMIVDRRRPRLRNSAFVKSRTLLDSSKVCSGLPRSGSNKSREPDHAASPLHQAHKDFLNESLLSGLERSDK